MDEIECNLCPTPCSGCEKWEGPSQILAWRLGRRVTVERIRIGWTVGIEWVLGNFYLSAGKYAVIIHPAREKP